MLSPETTLSVIGFDDLPNGVLVVRDGGCIMGANTAMLDLLGSDIDLLVGQRLSKVLTRSSSALYQSVVYQQLLGAGVVRETSLDLRRADGVEIPVVCSAAIHDKGAQAFIVICVTMVGARQRAEEASWRTRRVTEQIPGVVYQYKVSPDGTHSLPFASDALRTLFGLDPAQSQQNADLLLESIHPDDIGPFTRSITESAKTLKRWRGQFRTRRNGSEWRWLEAYSTPERLADGSTLWNGFLQDVSDRKIVEDALCQKQSAEGASQMKSQFLTRVSHELRTPLNAILGFSRVLTLDQAQPLQSVQRTRVGHIENAARDLLRLIDEVLDLTDVEAGDIRLELQWLNVKSLLGRVGKLVEDQARERGVELRLAAHSTLSVHADHARLGQVLTNLLSSALDHADDDGRVSLSCAIEDSHLHVSVHASGQGMSQAQMQHLFEPFNRQADERMTLQGSGLGLAIVKRLVEAMDGTISVESSAGSGATVHVRLPQRARVDEASTPPAAAPQRPVRAPTRRLPTVLYVEDNPVNAMIMQAICEMQVGMALHVASTGREAVDWLRSNRADLLLLDMNLPDVDGIALLQQLRDVTDGTPVEAVAVSADVSPCVMEMARAAGFSQYWTKPLDVEATLDRIAWALGIPRTLHATREVSNV